MYDVLVLILFNNCKRRHFGQDNETEFYKTGKIFWDMQGSLGRSL